MKICYPRTERQYPTPYALCNEMPVTVWVLNDDGLIQPIGNLFFHTQCAVSCSYSRHCRFIKLYGNLPACRLQWTAFNWTGHLSIYRAACSGWKRCTKPSIIMSLTGLRWPLKNTVNYLHCWWFILDKLPENLNLQTVWIKTKYRTALVDLAS